MHFGPRKTKGKNKKKKKKTRFWFVSLSPPTEIFLEAFGKSLDEVFDSIDPHPVASGSIAQVYKARQSDSLYSPFPVRWCSFMNFIVCLSSQDQPVTVANSHADCRFSGCT
jgi:hypothetical protein